MLPAFRVADWRVDPSLHTITGPSGPIRLEPKVLNVLTCLAERAGEVVAKEDFMDAVWAGTFVSDDVLARAISELRRAFGDDARRPRVIETVPKGGYRLVAPVAWEAQVDEQRIARAVMPTTAGAARAVVRSPTTAPGADWVEKPTRPGGAQPELSPPRGRILRPEFPDVDRHHEAVVSAPQKRWIRVTPGRAVTLGAALVLIGTAMLALKFYSADGVEPTVTEYRRLTRHEVLFPPFPSELPILTDGPRLYFNGFVNGAVRAGQVAASGGEPEPLSFGLAEHEFVDAISPDGSRLLVGAWESGSVLSDVPFWIVPLVGGTPRRLGDVTAHGSCWLPDGRIVYAHEHDLFVINADGSGQVKVASVGGKAYWPRVSPDGGRIRFSRFTIDATFRRWALWEVRMDGTGLRPLLPGWNDPAAECCGEWTPDGAYYVFQSTRDAQTHLWAIRETGGSLAGRPAPVQITHGPVQFRRPVFSRDGRWIFTTGWQARGELTAYSARSGALTPYFGGLSAEWLTHSRDGRWVTYVTYPEGELWRARADGSGRLRLSASDVRACCGRMSPDARHVVFVGQRGDAPARTYIISMDGAGLREIGTGGEADWSPDGTQFVIAGDGGLDAVTVDGGTRSRIPGSEGLSAPVWSPDGRRLAATSDGRLHVLDVATRQWRQLSGESAAFPNWSRRGTHLYFFTGRPAPFVIDGISRWDLSSDRVERVSDVRAFRLAWGISRHWLGLAPDDSPLFLRELSTHDLYALGWHPGR